MHWPKEFTLDQGWIISDIKVVCQDFFWDPYTEMSQRCTLGRPDKVISGLGNFSRVLTVEFLVADGSYDANLARNDLEVLGFYP